jgi:hypothetical protein
LFKQESPLDDCSLYDKYPLALSIPVEPPILWENAAETNEIIKHVVRNKLKKWFCLIDGKILTAFTIQFDFLPKPINSQQNKRGRE